MPQRLTRCCYRDGAASTVNYKLNCPARGKRYVEAPLEIGSQKLLTTPAATEGAVIKCLCESAADQVASGTFCPHPAPSVQFGRAARGSGIVESCKSPLSEELCTRKPFPYSM